MPGQRLNVVVTRRLPESVETRMKELFDVSLREVDTPMRREELVVALQEADVLVPTVTDQIDASLAKGNGRAGRPRRSWGGALRGGALAFWAWAALGRPSRGARAPLACRCITTTANACAQRSKSNLRQPIGKASTKWWRGWM